MLLPVVLEDVELPGVLRDAIYIDLRSSGPEQPAFRLRCGERTAGRRTAQISPIFMRG
jgi:hypothetical protein